MDEEELLRGRADAVGRGVEKAEDEYELLVTRATTMGVLNLVEEATFALTPLVLEAVCEPGGVFSRSLRSPKTALLRIADG